MLKYLIAVSQDLIVAAILSGLLYALVDRSYGSLGRKCMHIGLIVGAVAAAVMSYLKNATSLVHTGVWNMRIFITATVALILLIIFIIPTVRKKAPEAAKWIVCIAAALIAALLLFYELPDVYAYPYSFRKYNSYSVFSTEYLFRFIGFLGGLVLALLAFFAARYTSMRSQEKTAVAVTVAALGVNAVEQICKTLSTMLTRRMIKSTRTLFSIVKFTSNNSRLFIYLSLILVALLAIILWARSLHVNEPYSNPAQHRRIIATWRSNRRWASLLLVCCLLMVLNMTVFYALDNKPVVLSEAEEYAIEQGNIYVSLAQVEDGHLHLFAYTTDNGVETRFIVIKKPNSSAYGIGLDACDICGETGYYERDGQVVCKLCDVVMNINTIGFQGGCNPIPIDYRISEGYIIVPISTLVDHEKAFR